MSGVTPACSQAKQRSGAAPPRHHFVGDKQNTVGVADPLHLREHPGRIDQHAAGAEDQRLDDQRRDRPRSGTPS